MWEQLAPQAWGCKGPGCLQEATVCAADGGDDRLAGVEAFSAEMPATNRNKDSVLFSSISLRPVAPIFPN